ncbi:MAG: hypothetical protein AAGI23_19585, partial [Bacteroidota bacterium]
ARPTDRSIFYLSLLLRISLVLNAWFHTTLSTFFRFFPFLNVLSPRVKNLTDLVDLSNDSKESYYKSLDFDLFVRFHRNYELEQKKKRSTEYEQVVENNLKFIIAQTESSTFPGITKIGMDDEQFKGQLKTCNLDNAKVIVTLLHAKDPIVRFGLSPFIKAIKAGQLHPRQFAHIYTFERNRVSALYKNSNQTELNPVLDKYYFEFPFDRQNSTRNSDETRAKFGICSLETDQKLEQLAQKYGMKFRFGYQ